MKAETTAAALRPTRPGSGETPPDGRVIRGFGFAKTQTLRACPALAGYPSAQKPAQARGTEAVCLAGPLF